MFASGLLNHTEPAHCEDAVLKSDPSIAEIAADSSLAPLSRAYFLLKFASAALENPYKPKALDRKTQDPATARMFRRRNYDSSPWDAALLPWAQTLCRRPSRVIGEHVQIADLAIREAIAELDSTVPQASKLQIYFIASRLSQITKNTVNEQFYKDKIEQAIDACEKSSNPSELEIKAVTTILGLMSYAIVPVLAPESRPAGGAVAQTAAEDRQFLEAEKLKLRSIALSDRLPVESQIRRRAHRDLSLWYSMLGRDVKAEQQKKILFELIGSTDDDFLWPQDAGCGHVVWWRIVSNREVVDCGMG